jgi:hypothetical protein
MKINDEIQRLEMLSESIKNEIDELRILLEHSDQFLLKTKKAAFIRDLNNIISNLESSNDSVYGVFEELNAQNGDNWEEKYKTTKELLSDKLSYEEKTYYTLKYDIDFWEV